MSVSVEKVISITFSMTIQGIIAFLAIRCVKLVLLLIEILALCVILLL